MTPSPGATVQLTTANTDEILAGTRDALARAAAEFPGGSQPEAALIFSCSVRKFLLGSRTRVEAEMASSDPSGEAAMAVPPPGIVPPGTGANPLTLPVLVTSKR